VHGHAAQRAELCFDRYFIGRTKAWGTFHDRFGRLRRRFGADIEGRWDGDELTLAEDFLFDDGETQRRVWRIRKLAHDVYEGRAGEVVGVARGALRDGVVLWRYDFPAATRCRLVARPLRRLHGAARRTGDGEPRPRVQVRHRHRRDARPDVLLDVAVDLEHNMNMHRKASPDRLLRRLGDAAVVTQKLEHALERMAPADRSPPSLAALVAGAGPSLRLIGAVAGLQQAGLAGAVALARVRNRKK
jgi:hypothetical protein